MLAAISFCVTDLSVVLHGVCIRQYLLPRNDESAGGAADLPFTLPGHRKIGLRMDTKHLQHGTRGLPLHPSFPCVLSGRLAYFITRWNRVEVLFTLTTESRYFSASCPISSSMLQSSPSLPGIGMGCESNSGLPAPMPAPARGQSTHYCL